MFAAGQARSDRHRSLTLIFFGGKKKEKRTNRDPLGLQVGV